MKKIISVWMVLFSFSLQAATPVFSSDLVKAFNSAKTAGQMVKSLESFLDEDSIKFINEKIKGHETAPMRIEKTGDTRLLVTADSLVFTIEFNEPVEADRFVFTINKKEVSFNIEDSDEKLWQAIAAALPNQKSESPVEESRFFLFDLLFPQAHANASMFMGLVLGGAAAYMLTRSVSGKKHCDEVERYQRHLKRCKRGGLTQAEEFLARRFMHKRIRPGRCHNQRQKLRACLNFAPRVAPQGMPPAVINPGTGQVYQ